MACAGAIAARVGCARTPLTRLLPRSPRARARRRVNEVTIVHCRPEIMGMVRKVSHLLEVESFPEYQARLARRTEGMSWKPELVVTHAPTDAGTGTEGR